MTEKPLISVVMPVYNSEKYVVEAVRSILQQTHENLEFIIINDGSTDNSEKIILGFEDSRIKYVNRANYGVAASLNYAIKISSGNLIARMDADDISYPDRLSTQFEYLSNNTDCVMTGSNADIIDMKGEYLYTSVLPDNQKEIVLRLKYTSPFFHSSVLFRKEIFEKCDGYYEPVKHHVEDFILWNKFLNHGRLYNIEKPLIKYRIVPDGLMSRSRADRRKMILIAQNILAGKDVSDIEMNIFDDKRRMNKSTQLSRYYCKVGCICLYHAKEGRRKAFKNFILSIRYDIQNTHAIFFLLLVLMPLSIINIWKRMRKIN